MDFCPQSIAAWETHPKDKTTMVYDVINTRTQYNTYQFTQENDLFIQV